MIRQTLRDLPVGLVQTYERILLKISKVPLPRQEIALRAFKWMVCSRRPMKAEELQEAVAFDGSDHSWDRGKIPDKDLMIETCRGLLVRDKEDGAVRFAHYTVHQYLLSAPAIGTHFQISPRSEVEAYVGEVCVTYLSFSDFETQIALRAPNVQLEHLGVLKIGGPFSIPTVLGIRKSLLDTAYRLLGGTTTTATPDIDYSKYLTLNRPRRPQAPSTLTEKYRLLEYVVDYWMDHTQVLEHALNAKLRRLVMYKTLSFEFRPWGANQHFGQYGCSSCSDPTKAKELPFMSLFHYAAHAGHWSLIESLVIEYCQHEYPVDETFLVACRQGQDLIVRNLMRQIRFDLSDGRAINIAVTAGQADVLKYLLDHNEIESNHAPSYDIDSNASSLLISPGTSGHENVVDLILNHCRMQNAIYVNKVDKHTGRTALHLAVMNGHENIVRKLLAVGAETKTNGTTAIHIAAEYGYPNILRILFKATSEIPDSNRDTEMKDNESKFQDGSTFLRFYDTEGDTPLHKAARNGHSAAVETILEHRPTIVDVRRSTKVDFNGEHHLGLTSFHLAASGGHLSVLETLAHRKAHVNTKGGPNDATALHVAAAEGHQAIVEWLLENGADPHAKTNENAKALNFACRKGHEALVRVLLKKDTETPRNPYEQFMIVHSIELAVRERRDEERSKALLGQLLGCVGICVGAFGEDYLKRLIQTAQKERYHKAIGALKSLQEERRWEQDTDL